jgi:hypothetical protein
VNFQNIILKLILQNSTDEADNDFFFKANAKLFTLNPQKKIAIPKSKELQRRRLRRITCHQKKSVADQS